jgi:hypothetical protein
VAGTVLTQLLLTSQTPCSIILYFTMRKVTHNNFIVYKWLHDSFYFTDVPSSLVLSPPKNSIHLQWRTTGIYIFETKNILPNQAFMSLYKNPTGVPTSWETWANAVRSATWPYVTTASKFDCLFNFYHGTQYTVFLFLARNLLGVASKRLEVRLRVITVLT